MAPECILNHLAFKLFQGTIQSIGWAHLDHHKEILLGFFRPERSFNPELTVHYLLYSLNLGKVTSFVLL